MRNIVFVAPFPAEITMRFVRATAALDDVRLFGVVMQPPRGKDARLYADTVKANPYDPKELIAAVGELRRRHGQPFRIMSILEQLMEQVAAARAAFDIEGTRPEVAQRFRDKSVMKAALAKAGLPVARNRLLRNAKDARAFAEEVGFPMVLKPPSGVGSKATYRMRSLADLGRALEGLGVSDERPILAEEFLRGREFSFDTITVDGKIRFHSISHYAPPCLEAVENPWIQWCDYLPRDISGPEYDPIRKIGQGAITALGLDSGATHMEWFQRDDGSFAIGEIAQRPPGANISPMISWAHDQSMYRAWARAVVDGTFDGPWERKYAAGCAFLRGPGRGRVAGATGIGEVHRMLGDSIVEAKLPAVGAPKSDSYEGDGYMIVRDRDTEKVKKMLDAIIRTVRVYYTE